MWEHLTLEAKSKISEINAPLQSFYLQESLTHNFQNSEYILIKPADSMGLINYKCLVCLCWLSEKVVKLKP